MLASRKALSLGCSVRRADHTQVKVADYARAPGGGASVVVRQSLSGPVCCSTGDNDGGKTGVAEKPSSTTTKENSTKSVTKKPPTYKVMLHNDSFNKREKVVSVLMKVVEGMTMEGALVVMKEAHETGVAVVIACPQDEAEKYCEQLRLNGLTSTIEA